VLKILLNYIKLEKNTAAFSTLMLLVLALKCMLACLLYTAFKLLFAGLCYRTCCVLVWAKAEGLLLVGVVWTADYCQWRYSQRGRGRR